MPTPKRPPPSPDSAADLWGHKPRKAVTCDGCGQHAEPYRRKLCFLCATAGPKYPPHTPGRAPAQPPRPISPVYTAVRVVR